VDHGLPSYDELPIREDAPPGSSWGLWGDPDYFGCLNLLTPERAASAAARCVRSGRSFGLNLDFGQPDPPLFGRGRMHHEVTGPLGGGHDDILHNWNTQSSSQWDGFRHIAHPEHGHFGGVPDQDHGVHHWSARGLVGRGVLADVDRWRSARGRSLKQGALDPIPVAELAACLADQGTEVEVGDVLLFRTGWTAWYRSLDRDDRIRLGQPGKQVNPGLEPGPATISQLWNWHIAAVASDNPAVESWPPSRDVDLFLHFTLLPLLGMPLGELFDLDPLAEECASSGRWDFLFVSAPINVRGGVASPPNAVAIC
jgi:kynurenine formamidase